jgi:Flp pilus assembly protein TadG
MTDHGSSKSRKRRERGQAIVEAALALLVFICLMVGTLDFGQFLYMHQSLTERVRAGARYGAAHSYDYPGDAIKNFTVYNDPNPPAGTPGLVPNLTVDKVKAELIAEGTDASRIRVTITNYPFTFFSPWIARQAKARDIIASIPYEWGL